MMAAEDLTGPPVLNVQSDSRWSGSVESATPRKSWLPRNIGQSEAGEDFGFKPTFEEFAEASCFEQPAQATTKAPRSQDKKCCRTVLMPRIDARPHYGAAINLWQWK
jgi:hypothetical protein